MASQSFSIHSLSLLLIFFISLLLRAEANKTLSLFFPLTSAPLTSKSSDFLSSLAASPHRSSAAASSPPSVYSSKMPFKYTMALIAPLPIGTPPQVQRMVIDTGSQLSWFLCHRKMTRTTTPTEQPPPATSFDPSLSKSFSPLPCTHPLCKPRIPDFTLPTTCDPNRLCHYSYFYADGTLAEGNLVREKFAFSGAAQTTPPLILGCAAEETGEAEGILGMNLGRLSFARQARVLKFSYCTPLNQGGAHRRPNNLNPTGAFYLGQNPNSQGFRYVDLLTIPNGQRMPNFDPLAYTVPFSGIKIGGRRLSIPTEAFRPDAGGSGQTMIDSGTQYTFLVDPAYAKVREEVVRLVGPKLKGGFVYGGALDMCFNEPNAAVAGQSIGDVAFVFENGVEISINKERIMDDVGGGVHCVAIGRSDSLGVASNIIGNYYQQNLWVEFDLIKKRVGLGVADCSRSM